MICSFNALKIIFYVLHLVSQKRIAIHAKNATLEMEMHARNVMETALAIRMENALHAIQEIFLIMECEGRSNYCTKCEEGKLSYGGACYSSCSQIGVGFGTQDDHTCIKCDLDQCITYDYSCQCLECNDGYSIVTHPKTQIEVCVPCSLDNCKKCSGIEKDDCTELKTVKYVQLIYIHVKPALTNIIFKMGYVNFVQLKIVPNVQDLLVQFVINV